MIIYTRRNQSIFMRGFEWLAIFVIILFDIDVPIMRKKHGVGKRDTTICIKVREVV